MSKATEILKSIRLGFADAKFFFKNIPTIIKGIKSSAKKELLRVYVHNITDGAIEMYGDILTDYAENLNLDAIQSVVEDICFLVTKHEEPLTQTAIALGKAFQKTVEKFEENAKTDTKAAGKIIEGIIKELGLDNLKTPSILKREEEYAEEKHENAKKEHELAQKKETLRKRHILNLRHLVTESQYELRGDTTKTYETWLKEEAVKLTETSFMS